MDEFPPNSRKAEAQVPKRVEQVTSGPAVRRKRGLGKQIKDTFFGGNAKIAAQFTFTDVIIPAAQDMLLEFINTMSERLVLGESRRTRRPSGPMQSALGHIAYNQMRPQQPAGPKSLGMSQRARARHDFGEIIIDSRQEAEEVLDRMFDILGRYEEVSVADLYALVGIKATHVDTKWGWSDLRASGVGRVRGGGAYVLDLPDPEPLQ